MKCSTSSLLCFSLWLVTFKAVLRAAFCSLLSAWKFLRGDAVSLDPEPPQGKGAYESETIIQVIFQGSTIVDVCLRMILKSVQLFL